MYHLSENIKTHQSAELIYTALINLIIEKDISDITVKELVSNAGVGRATFYRLFDAIPDVLTYKCDKIFKDLNLYIADYRKSMLLTEGIPSNSLLKPLLRFWYLDSLIIEVLIKSGRLDILLSNIEDLFGRMFDRMNKDNNKDFHKDYFISIRAGILFNILVKWVKNKKNLPPDELADILLKQFRQVIDLQLLD